MFENELAKVIIEAYVKAMDTEILTGDPDDGEMEGILTEAAKSQAGRLKGQIIEFTAEDMADWKQWQKKLFAKIPLAMRAAAPQFVMTANTYEANIKTLVDDNNRPVYNETYNPVDGAERATFKGKEVVFVEEGLGFENFDDATNGEYFGMYWIPEKGYAINTNLEFAVKRYFDEEKLQWVDRAVVINDGKILDPKYIYLLKKKVKVSIMEVNRQRRRVKGSIRAAEYAERKAKADEVWSNIEIGKKYTGTVKSITSYGAFVDIGGVDGMVHITELSWSRIKNPAEVVAVGDEIEVYVIGFDTEKKKISLGHKDPNLDPWKVFRDKYEVGDVAEVKIVKNMPFGSFAEIVPGVDGLIHISQISEKRIVRPADAVEEGQIVNVKIIEIDDEKKKVSLSMRQAIVEEEAEEVEE